MPKTTPALVTQTKLENDGATDVKVTPKRTVTYVINISSAENLSIPYAVSVDGAVQEEFKSKPRRVSGDRGRIVIKNVDPGKQVALFLNSDAHPSYRNNPVYPVTPGDHDVIVKIDEKPGKNVGTDVPTKTMTKDDVGGGKVDTYSAILTGDIWMRISHKYSVGEVDALLPADTSPAIIAAVKKIYAGLGQALLDISALSASPGAMAKTVSITFDDGDNPRENINSGYDFLKEGLTRVHPAGYAAIFGAAISAGVERVAMTSAWRPMLGSIAHRAGLGLDVNYIGTVRINRQKLRSNSAIDAHNVTAEEKNLFAAFQTSKTQQSAAKKAVEQAEAEVKKCQNDAAKLIVAKQNMKRAIDGSVEADEKRKEAEAAWNAERDKNEPDCVRRFRAALIKSKSIVQLFDPWFMDSNTRDNVIATPNMQIDGNEKLHSHHLHVTVYEPKIL
jgi:hypothetical protein